MKNEPVFLTDKNHNIVLEALSPAPNAALPDSCNPFEILDPAATEGAAEKHLPVVEQDGLHVTVKVGNIFHPMGQEHSIGWVCLVTKAGCVMRVPLTPDCEPVASFTLEEGDAPAAAYAYCNPSRTVEKINLIPSGKTLPKQPRMTVFIPAAITGAEYWKHQDKK